MRAIRVLLVGVIALARLAGQTEAVPKLREISRIDYGLGGVLISADGKEHSFHLAVTAIRARFVDQHHPTASARELPVGSEEEKELLQLLEAWAAATFSAEEQKDLLAIERLPDPRTQEEDDAHTRASLVRALRLYEEVTRPQITKVFAGRGTVSLSLQMQLGNNAPKQLLWRRLGDDHFARVYLDTDTEPVPIESRNENRLLLGIANWLAAQLGSRERLWQPEPKDIAEDVRLVLQAYRGYLVATSPRLRSAGTVMDKAGGGTRLFVFSDHQNRESTVRFDYAAETKTPGRLRDGGGRDAPLVDVGSEREAALLAILRRAAELRRRWLGATADKDWQLQMLETELKRYETAFLEDKKGK